MKNCLSQAMGGGGAVTAPTFKKCPDNPLFYKAFFKNLATSGGKTFSWTSFWRTS